MFKPDASPAGMFQHFLHYMYGGSHIAFQETPLFRIMAMLLSYQWQSSNEPQTRSKDAWSKGVCMGAHS